jgi:hypothetical protein
MSPRALRDYYAAMRRADSYDDAADALEQLRQAELDEEYAADCAGMEDDEL